MRKVESDIEEQGGQRWEREIMRWQTENMVCMIHRLHPHIRTGPDVAGTRKRNGIQKEGNERDIVSQTLLQKVEDMLLTATLSQSFFFPIAMPNSILKVTTQRYICLPLAVVFC